MKIFFSPPQVQQNTKFQGGFLATLASLLIPIIAGAATVGIEHAINKRGNGIAKTDAKRHCEPHCDGDKCMMLHTKQCEIIRVTPESGGDGLWLRPYGKVLQRERDYLNKHGYGLYLRRGRGMEKIGQGLAFGIY